jgi:hypothetical protein
MEAEKVDKAEEQNVRRRCGVKLPADAKLVVLKSIQIYLSSLAGRLGRINKKITP